MPNDYSIEIHNYLTEKITEAERALVENSVASLKQEGQIDELLWLRKYLRKNIDLKDFTYY